MCTFAERKFLSMHKLKSILIALVCTVAFSSCSKFHRLMKSTDMEAKYTAAVKYFDKKDYYHALQLLEELNTVYRGTSKAEMTYYYYTFCTYYIDDFTLAAYHFNNFVQSYPNSKYAEEMQYMYAYCYYLDSPIASLDQTSTIDAIDKFQIYINKFPGSERVAEANKLIDELRAKLERKAFDNAEMYYRTEHYKAAVVAFSNALKDYPNSQFREKAMYLSFRSAYLYADNSVEAKKAERYRAAREDYLRLIDNFPKSRYLREAENLYDSLLKKIGGAGTAQNP